MFSSHGFFVILRFYFHRPLKSNQSFFNHACQKESREDLRNRANLEKRSPIRNHWMRFAYLTITKNGRLLTINDTDNYSNVPVSGE